MDQPEREDSSLYLTNRQSPYEPGADRPTTPTLSTEPGENKSKVVGVLTVLLLLGLIGAGIMGWMLYDTSNQAASVKNKLDDSEKKIATLQSQLKVADAVEKTKVETSTDTKDEESERILKVAIAYTKADKNFGQQTFDATIASRVGDFAYVSIIPESGFGQVLKLSDGEWVVVATAHGEVSKATMDQFGIPHDLFNSN